MKDSEHPCNIPPRDAFRETFLFPGDSIPCRETIVPETHSSGDTMPNFSELRMVSPELALTRVLLLTKFSHLA